MGLQQVQAFLSLGLHTGKIYGIREIRDEKDASSRAYGKPEGVSQKDSEARSIHLWHKIIYHLKNSSWHAVVFQQEQEHLAMRHQRTMFIPPIMRWALTRPCGPDSNPLSDESGVYI